MDRGVIVVGVDGSAGSLDALRWALPFAAATDQQVAVVNVEAAPTTKPPPSQDTSRASSDADRTAWLRELSDEALDGASDAVDVVIASGDTSEEILGEAATRDASTIVVGARGLGAIRGHLLGSVSRQCLRQSTRPVVVVPGGAPVTVPERILVGVDGTTHAQRALLWAIDLAHELDAEIVGVHAVGSEAVAAASTRLRERFHHEWCQPLRDAGVRHREVFAHDTARRELPRVADRVDAGLMVVGTRRRGTDRLPRLGSVALNLAEHCRRPLAVVR
ncbi:MAG: universal stress protein [Acidimicrobiales bacterium]|nr:universal stress protein [Acidimicrobiales bacterium]